VVFWDAVSHSLLHGVNSVSKKPPVCGRQRSSVVTVTRLGVGTRTNLHTTFGRFKRFFFFFKQPDRLRIPPSLILSGCRRLFPEGKATRALSCHLPPKPTMSGGIPLLHFDASMEYAETALFFYLYPLHLYTLDFDTAQSATWFRVFQKNLCPTTLSCNSLQPPFF
jgi:hypothetical protein